MAPNFFDDPERTHITINLYNTGFSVLGIVYVGLNRLSVIPFLVALFHALGSFFTWYNHSALDANGNPGAANTASVFFCNVSYFTGELIIVMYGYFIVEVLLPNDSAVTGPYTGIIRRKTFMWIFWPLQTGHLILRVGGVTFATVDYVRTGDSVGSITLFYIVQAQFIMLAVIEVFTAYLLIVIFRRSRKTSIRFLSGKRLGLFKHLLLSTEIRVASLAILYTIRVCCEIPKRTSKHASRIDLVAVDVLSLFPIMLVADCILRRSFQLEIDLQSRKELCKCLDDGAGAGAGGDIPKRPRFIELSHKGSGEYKSS